MNTREPFVWLSGQFLPLSQAAIPVRSHVIRYGSNVFTGMRGYPREHGVALMRLGDHIARLLESAAIYNMINDLPWDSDTIRSTIIEAIIRNREVIKGPYVNASIFRGTGSLNVSPKKCSVEMMIDVLDWGKYLPDPCRVKVASWSRLAPNTLPMMAKCGGNYPNGALMKMEAEDCEADEALGLTPEGYISDASGANIFLGYRGELWTPPMCDCGLPGITRRSIITIAYDLGITVHSQEHLPREMLLVCDEAFLCGSAAEVTSIGQIDGRKLTAPGEMTKAIADKFFGIAEGRLPDKYNWMTTINF